MSLRVFCLDRDDLSYFLDTEKKNQQSNELSESKTNYNYRCFFEGHFHKMRKLFLKVQDTCKTLVCNMSVYRFIQQRKE